MLRTFLNAVFANQALLGWPMHGVITWDEEVKDPSLRFSKVCLGCWRPGDQRYVFEFNYTSQADFSAKTQLQVVSGESEGENSVQTRMYKNAFTRLRIRSTWKGPG